MASRIEDAMLSEAVVISAATEDLARKYCEELISASRDVVGAWYRAKRPNRDRPLGEAIRKLQSLVGRP
jgi:hypothetical protein